MKKIVILISGRGSNMEAIIREQAAGRLPVRIAAVISNRPDARGLITAAQAAIATQVVDHKSFTDRDGFDAALTAVIDGYAPDLVVLAGFMRILGDDFVRHFAGRLINIHPSLLPAFPGLHTHRQALAEGVRLHGCTVHFVTPTLDHGPIIVQAAVPVLDTDDEESLAARVLAQEHLIYPRAIHWFATGRIALDNGRVRIDAPLDGSGALTAPALR